MLPKSQRLNLKKDFKWVAAGSPRGAGKKIEGKYLKLFIRMGKNDNPRVGIALSSKTFRKAADRNRAKRLLSQAFQSTIYHLPSTINIIALPKPGIVSVKSQDVLLDLESILNENEKNISQLN